MAAHLPLLTQPSLVILIVRSGIHGWGRSPRGGTQLAPQSAPQVDHELTDSRDGPELTVRTGLLTYDSNILDSHSAFAIIEN